MITLQSDRLYFSFPEISSQLEPRLERYIEAILPDVVAENRAAAIRALEGRWDFPYASLRRRKDAVKRLTSVTAAEIECAFRKQCRGFVEPSWNDEIASGSVEFERTLRIPDDNKTYPLPAGLGNFPLRHVDDFAQAVPDMWRKRGGVMMPMHQSEALWLNFGGGYPFAVKVAAGKINAVTGENWTRDLQDRPQNYLVRPEQPWLDGFAVGKGLIRQFVAMPLGDGYSVEEQLTGRGETGGIQLQFFPMKADAYFRHELADSLPKTLTDLLDELVGDLIEGSIGLCAGKPGPRDSEVYHGDSAVAEGSMGLGAGGMMRQEIYDDPYEIADWDQTMTSRCFVHLCNSLEWRQITGSNPLHPPLTAKEYAQSGIPWFDYYRDDLRGVDGSKTLGNVRSVAQLAKDKGISPLPANSSIEPALIVQYGNTRRPDQVREWVEP